MLGDDEDYKQLRPKTTLAVDHYIREQEKQSAAFADNFMPTFDTHARTLVHNSRRMRKNNSKSIRNKDK